MLLDICSDLFDRLTAVKGFIELNNRNKSKKIDYSFLILQEINDFERLLIHLVDLINNHSDKK